MASRRLQRVLAGVSTPVAPATVSASEDPVVATSKVRPASLLILALRRARCALHRAGWPGRLLV